MYRRSNDNGFSWEDTLEVGTNHPWSGAEDYHSVDEAALRDEYLLYLRPSIVLNPSGWPGVTWHADCSEGGGEEGGGGSESYVIYYSYATSVTTDTVTWITPTVLIQEQLTMLGSAGIGVGESSGEDPLLHVVYMQKPVGTGAWEVYYDSNEDLDRYYYVYLPLTMRNGAY